MRTLVAEAKRTNHRSEIVEPSDYGVLGQLGGIYDEPFADSSAIPTYRVCQLARRHVTVALSGDGGDENFIGYRRYRLFAAEEAVRSRIPAPVRRALFGPLGRLYPKLDWAPRVLRGKTTFQALARGTVDAYLHAVSFSSDEVRTALFSQSFRSQLQGYHAREVFHGHVEGKTFSDPLALVQYLDFKTYLPGDILTKVDRASMAHSLEVRTPFLDYEFVEWVRAATHPREAAARGGQAHPEGGAATPCCRRKCCSARKMGFGVPHRAVVQRLAARAPGGDRHRTSASRTAGIFEPRALRRLVAEHDSGRRDHSAALWSLLMFDGFPEGRRRRRSRVTGSRWAGNRPCARPQGRPRGHRIVTAPLQIVSVCRSLPAPDDPSRAFSS